MSASRLRQEAEEFSKHLLSEPAPNYPRNEAKIIALEESFVASLEERPGQTRWPLKVDGSRFVSRLQELVKTAAKHGFHSTQGRRKEGTRRSGTAQAPASLSMSGQIDAAVRDRDLEAAERIIQASHGRAWSRLSKLVETTDAPRALSYAQRAYDLDRQPKLARRIYRLARSLGHIVLAERMLRAVTDAADGEISTGDLKTLEMLNGWKNLLEQGFPLSERRISSAYVPIPDKALYCLHNSLPHSSAGYATRSHGVLRSLNAAGMSVIGLTRLGHPWDLPANRKLDPQPDFPDEDVVDGVIYRRLRSLDRGWRQVPQDQYLQACADAIVQAAAIERPSIIHAASNWMVGVPAVAAARHLGLPSIYEVRGLWEITRLSRQPSWQGSDEYQTYVGLETEAAMGADVVIAITNALKQEMVRRGVPENKVMVVPNSVDPDAFKPIPRDDILAQELGLDGAPVVGYVGSFSQYEGLDDLLHALSVVIDRGTPLKLLLVGDGAELERLRSLTVDLELEKEVVLTGRVPFDTVQRYYSLIDIAAFPRKPLPVTEMVSPMKPFEAMAMRKAILVSSVGALAEIVVDGETGLVFEKGNIDSMADALERLAADATLRSQLGQNAQQWVTTNRTWDRAGATLADVYRRLQHR